MYSEHANISLSNKGRVINEIINMLKQNRLEVKYTISGINVNIKCKDKRGLKVFGLRINNDKSISIILLLGDGLVNVTCNVTSDDINYLGDLIRTNTGIILTPDSAENDRLEKIIVRNLLNLIENQSV